MKHTTHTILFFLALFAAVAAHAQVQPQFKFYLAFEDAKYEKDTVWVVMDTLASNGMDTIFKEDTIQLDSGVFQVYFGNSNTWYTKVRAIKPGLLAAYVNSTNHQLPITMRWDTNLLKNHDLPFELKQAWAHYYPYFDYDVVHFYDTVIGSNIKGDSFVFTNHCFPIQAYFSKNPYPGFTGIHNISHKTDFTLSPNPASHELTIELHENDFPSTVQIFNNKGVLGYITELSSSKSILDVSLLQPGVYTLVLSNEKSNHYENLVILR